MELLRGFDSRVSLLQTSQAPLLCRISHSHRLLTFKRRQAKCAIRACAVNEPWQTWIASAEAMDAKQIRDHDSLRSSSKCFVVVERRVSRLLRIQEFLPCIGRGLLIVGLGLCFGTPAFARNLVPPNTSTTISVDSSDGGRVVENESKDKAVAIDTNGVFSQQSVTSDNKKDVSNSVERRHDASSNAMKLEEGLHLSEAFWRGIPTPEGSFMNNLKVQLSNHPGDSKALQVLLRAVMEKRDMLRALTVLETLLELQPDNLKWKFFKARAHEFLGEYAMAKMGYEELVNRQPFSARFMQGLAMLLEKLGEGAQALKLIQAALERAQSEKKIVEARNLGILLSQFYIQLGNFDNALQQLNGMIDEDPDDFRPYLCQGLAYTLMDQTDKAEENFRKYKQLCPPDSLEQSYLDELMLAAKVDRQNDAILKAALKSSFKKRKKSTIMKHPSVSGQERMEQQSSENS